MEVLELKVAIETSAATKSVKEIGPAAKEAAKEVSSAMNKAENSIEDVGEEAKTAAKKTKELGDAAGDTATNAGQLSGALDLVSPAAGDVARVVADAADALEVFTRALNVSKAVAGGVAVVVAALGAGYLYLRDQLNEAEAAQEAMSEAATAAESRFATLKGLVSGLADEMSILNGASQAEIDLERQLTAISTAYAGSIADINRQLFETKNLREEIRENMSAADLVEDMAAIDLADQRISNLQTLRDNTIQARDEALSNTRILHQARQDEIKDLEDQRAALEALRAAEAAARQAASIQASAQNKMAALQLESLRLQGDEIGILEMQYHQEIAAIDQLAAAAAAAGVVINTETMKQMALQNHLMEVEQLRLSQKAEETAAEMARLEELAALEEQIAAERQARDEAIHQEAMRQIEERRNGLMQIIASTSLMFGSVSDAFQLLADSQVASNSDAAMKSFEISKKLAIAEVMFNLASGIMEAMTLPPIVRGAKIAALTVASGVQIATISQQEPPTAHMGDTGLTQRMHMGGTADSAGQQTVILRNEAVLDSATTRRLGPEGVQSLLNGAGSARASRTVVTYRHLDQAVGDLLKNNGSRSARNARSAARQPSTMGTTRAYQ